MELRKCECGFTPYSQVGYCIIEGETIAFVVCPSCLEQTEDYSSELQAIQAWNEGKVE